MKAYNEANKKQTTELNPKPNFILANYSVYTTILSRSYNQFQSTISKHEDNRYIHIISTAYW